MKNMEKTLNVGTLKIGKFKRQIFIDIEIFNGILSIDGAIGPKANGNCFGSAGQIRGVLCDPDLEINSEWTPELVELLSAIWKKYHLNDAKLECAHQQIMDWEFNRDAEKQKVCPICGYSLGSEWRTLSLHEAVFESLEKMPETKIAYPWE